MSAKQIVHNLDYSINQIDALVSKIKNAMQSCSVVTLSGPLGAGKTTLARELLRACGVTGIIGSPTFTYVNRYENAKNEVFYHFDLYRLTSAHEFQQAGFDEYLCQPRSWAIIEWPEVIDSLLKKNVCAVTISYHSDADKRCVEIVYTPKVDHE